MRIIYIIMVAGSLLVACSNAAGKKAGKSDSLTLAQAKQDSTRKAAFKNHDLTIIFLEASAQLIQCQLLLEKADPGGQQYGVTDTLLVTSKKGDTLYRAMNKLFDAGVLFATSEPDKERFAEQKAPDSSNLWLEKNFKGVQSVDALNTLSRWQKDCNVIRDLAPH
jgi:hypothetical protein